MCRPQAAGGRRCPLHASSGFVGTRLARRTSGLDTRQVNATFQVLRQHGHRAEEPTVQQWADYLQEQAQTAESSQYSSRTMRAIRQHIVQAADETPDGPTYYALTHLQERTRQQKQALHQTLNNLSTSLGLSRTEVTRRFNALRAEVDMSRGASMPSGYSERAFLSARDAGIPLDTPTIHAYGTLTQEPAAPESEERRRITLEHIPGTSIFARAGYDPSGDHRVELELSDHDGRPSGRILAYRNVPPEIWQEFLESPLRTYHTHIRVTPHRQYLTVDDANAASMARRCANCGQFAADPHTCPSLAVTSDDNDLSVVSTPGGTDTTTSSEEVSTSTSEEVSETQEQPFATLASLREEELYQREEERRDIIRQNELRQAVREIRAEEAVAEESDRSAQLPEAITPSEYTIDDLDRNMTIIDRDHVNYDEDPEGKYVVPFETNDATGGLCAPGGIGFGVELEFDAEHSSLERIGERLHEEGILESPYQQEYHAGAAERWTGWSFEHDQTVGGELVSPIMYDRPEDWEKLEKICRIVKEEGGYVSPRTGGHVHVSSDVLGQSVLKHTEVVNLVNENEDLLYRMGTNPDLEEHRSLYWCGPNDDVDDRYVRHAERYPFYSRSEPERNLMHYFKSAHSGHELGVNLAASGEESGNHIEFRQFDGTLDPGIIQAQIKMSAAIVAHAARTAPTEGGPRQVTRREIGVNVEEERTMSRVSLDSDDMHRDSRNIGTEDFRKFVSTLFSREQDRIQLTTLFAATKWQSDLSTEDENSSW